MEYVVAYAVCHFRERNHADRFWATMVEVMPDWRGPGLMNPAGGSFRGQRKCGLGLQLQRRASPAERVTDVIHGPGGVNRMLALGTHQGRLATFLSGRERRGDVQGKEE